MNLANGVGGRRNSHGSSKILIFRSITFHATTCMHRKCVHTAIESSHLVLMMLLLIFPYVCGTSGDIWPPLSKILGRSNLIELIISWFINVIVHSFLIFIFDRSEPFPVV